MHRKKRVLITGASGFVGSHLCRFLYAKNFEIWAVFHQRIKRWPFPVHWLQADLTRPNEALEVLRKTRPHMLFHLAGQAVPREAWKDAGRTHRLNVLASIFLLEGMARFASEARLVLVSSLHAYGSSCLKKRRVDEKDLANPLTPYGGSKLLMELVANNFFKTHHIQAVIARASNQVGVGQNPSFAFADFCRQIALIEKKKKAPILEVGNLQIERDFIHIRDAVQGYYVLASRGNAGEIYNVSSGRGLRLSEAIEFLKAESRVPFKVVSFESRRQRNDLPCIVADNSKLRKLGWRPQVSIWQGLQELLEDWRQRVK